MTASGDAAGGVNGLDGQWIDGAHTGKPGSDDVTSVDWSKLAITPAMPAARALVIHKAQVPAGPVAQRAAKSH